MADIFLFGLFSGILLVTFTIVLRFSIRDARRRGRSPLLVTLLVLCSFPLGLLAWLLFRPEPLAQLSGPSPYSLNA